jgi:chloramphenicol-sensitive protein RarD
MISFNWGIFIWAVEAGRIVETSMGYYISPLMNVLFGVVFLRERLAKLQIAAVSCAAVGIGVIIVHNGGLPWVALTLPLTFAFYGLLKKIIIAQPMTSILLETLLISPLAVGYLYYLSINEGTVYQSCDMNTLLLLAGAGAVTATPMLLFTACARKLPLNIVGFLQYISPSISLMIGVLIYGEPFTGTTATAFGCIWAGLALFIWSQIRR